jgi:hypothetical protein
VEKGRKTQSQTGSSADTTLSKTSRGIGLGFAEGM